MEQSRPNNPSNNPSTNPTTQAENLPRIPTTNSATLTRPLPIQLSQQWVPVIIVDILQRLVQQQRLREPSKFDIPRFESLRPIHITLFTKAELYSILEEAHARKVLAIDDIPTLEMVSYSDIIAEVVAFFTAWSPYAQDYLTQSPDLRPYNAHIKRHQRHRVINSGLLHSRTHSIHVPWPSKVNEFNNRKVLEIVRRWLEQDFISNNPEKLKSSPTNCIAYLAAHAKTRGLPFTVPQSVTPLYYIPPDVTPLRFAQFLSGMKRVRLSARVNEQFISTIGCSFFLQESLDANNGPLYRARFHETRAIPNLDYTGMTIDANCYIRLRLVGIRPQQIVRDGLGPFVLKLPPKQPEADQLIGLTQLPEGELVREVREKWTVFPLVMATVPNPSIKPSECVALWVFPNQSEQLQINNNDPNVDKVEYGSGVLVMKPPELPLDQWKTKINAQAHRTQLTPIVDPVTFPQALTAQVIKQNALQLECAYRDVSQLNPPQMTASAGSGSQLTAVRNYTKPHPFRGCILVELTKILSTPEIIARVKSRPPLDVPKPVGQNVPSCPICNATGQLLRCAQCKQTSYCSIEHQREDWPKHKDACKQLAFEIQKEAQRNRQVDSDVISDPNATPMSSLDCPLSGNRCVIPTRGIACKHLRCFNLASWIEYNLGPSAKSNACPICTIPLHLDDLRVSRRHQIACDTLPSSVVDVELGPNDLFIPKKRANGGGDALYDDSDGDGSDGGDGGFDSDDSGSDGDIPDHLKRQRTNTDGASPRGGEMVQLSGGNTTTTLNNHNNNNNNSTITSQQQPQQPQQQQQNTRPAAVRPRPPPKDDDVIELD